jgi:biopolymer transport protein ExbD
VSRMKSSAMVQLKEAGELNIVAFMNLMVILVPFLLITAVFSEITILELYLPAKSATQAPAGDVELDLHMVVRGDALYIRDSNIGLNREFERVNGEFAWAGISAFLVEIKKRFPEQDNITLLLEPGVDYKTMIKAMDHARSADVLDGLSVVSVALFPNISIGDDDPSAR